MEIYVENKILRKEEDVDALKKKAIKDFQKFLKRLEVGYVDDYSMILNIISFIQTCQYFDRPNKIYEFLMNN